VVKTMSSELKWPNSAPHRDGARSVALWSTISRARAWARTLGSKISDLSRYRKMKSVAPLSLILLTQMVGGCATTYATKVGSRVENIDQYLAVHASEETLMVHYKPTIRPESSTTNLPDPPERWGVARLRSLSWVPLDSLVRDRWKEPTVRLSIECSASRTNPAPPPPIPYTFYSYSLDDHFISFASRDEAPIAAYYAGGLLLVRADPARQGAFQAARLLSPSECHYNEPWALYARVILVPMAIVVDIVTAPIQFIVGMVLVSGLGGMH
jgi:hypothetical protein